MEQQSIEQSINKKQRYTLIGLIVVLGLILFNQTRPYMSGLLGAFTLYVLLNRQMAFLSEKLKFGKAFSAIILLLEAFLFFLLPLTGVALLVIDTLSGIHIDPQLILEQTTEFINKIESRLHIEIFTPQNLSMLPKLGSNLIQILGSSVYSLSINAIVIIFVLYFMLYNYQSFGKIIREIIPFNEENKQILAEETRSIIKANAIGIPLLAIIQGFVAYLGYVFFGTANPLLFGIFTAFATILPVVGTTIVWLPLAIVLFVQGNLVGGIGLALYGAIAISGVDNVARFLLQKQLADIHPLITIFGVLIGIPMFGFWGVIFGPLLLSLFLLFFNMYRYEYIPGSTAEPRVTTKMKVQQVKLPSVKKNKKNESTTNKK